MLIFDGDYPAAHGTFFHSRDLTLPIDEVRANDNPEVVAMASLPEMRRGRVAGALFKSTARMLNDESILPGFRGAEATYAAARGDIEYYHALERNGEIDILTNRESFARHFSRWEQKGEDDAGALELPIGCVIGLECSDPIVEPSYVDDWWQHGVRVASLTHYGKATYAYGTGAEGGLRGVAAELLREMERRGMLLDMTHIADQSFWEALDIYSGPILASHQNCRALAPGVRQFSDEQLQAVIERDGVVGASMDTWMLLREPLIDWANTGSYRRRDTFAREQVTLAHLVDHINHVCELAGNSKHGAIGGDTDGQGGVDGAPYDVDTVADYQKIALILRDRGYSEDDVANVMYRNWQRLYETYLPAAGDEG